MFPRKEAYIICVQSHNGVFQGCKIRGTSKPRVTYQQGAYTSVENAETHNQARSSQFYMTAAALSEWHGLRIFLGDTMLCSFQLMGGGAVAYGEIPLSMDVHAQDEMQPMEAKLNYMPRDRKMRATAETMDAKDPISSLQNRPPVVVATGTGVSAVRLKTNKVARKHIDIATELAKTVGIETSGCALTQAMSQ